MSSKPKSAKTKTNGNTVGKGTRKNLNKPPLGLFSPLAKRGAAQVLGWACKGKYDPWNWARGLDIADVCDCLERHLDDLRMGKLIDKDSGLPVVDHVLSNAMFLSHYYHAGQWDALSINMPYRLEDVTFSYGDEDDK